MRLRGHVERLKQLRDEGRSGFRLKSGRWYSYNFEVEGGKLWVYCISCMGLRPDDEMEEPHILTMIRQAEDPDAALAPFRPHNPERALVDPALLFPEAFPELAEDHRETSRETRQDGPQRPPDLSDVPGTPESLESPTAHLGKPETSGFVGYPGSQKCPRGKFSRNPCLAPPCAAAPRRAKLIHCFARRALCV